MPVQKKDLFVKKSQIPGAGKGLFTKVDIKRGARITEYAGKIKKWKDIKDVEIKNRYLLYMNKNHVIDAEGNTECFGMYANDARGLNKEAHLKNNASYYIFGKKVFITASRNIKAGEEIFVSYGKEYWENIEL